MSKNDAKILQLKNLIEKKKEEVEKASITFRPTTNFVLIQNGQSLNLHTCTVEQLKLKAIELYNTERGALALGFEDMSINGFKICDWLSDIRNKIDQLELAQKKKDLKLMEAKLDTMLSEEKKIELELDDIANLLK